MFLLQKFLLGRSNFETSSFLKDIYICSKLFEIVLPCPVNFFISLRIS